MGDNELSQWNTLWKLIVVSATSNCYFYILGRDFEINS